MFFNVMTKIFDSIQLQYREVAAYWLKCKKSDGERAAKEAQMEHVMSSDRVCRGRLREKTGYGTRNAEM